MLIMGVNKLTIIPNMENEKYHLEPSLSASGAKTIAMKSLAHYKYSEPKTSQAFDLGTATHTLCLEPHRSNTVWCGPETRRGKAWSERKEEAEAAGAILLTEAEYKQANEMAKAVWANEEAAKILSGDIMIEPSIFVKDHVRNVDLRCRPDAWRKDIAAIIDLKTTIDPSPAGFASQAGKLGYHIQDQFYRMCLALEGHEIDRFVFIAVDKNGPPYTVGVYELDERSLREGRAAVEYALDRYVWAQKTGVWPYDYGELQTIQIPPYTFKFTEEQN